MAPGVAHELRLIRSGHQSGAGLPANAAVCGPGERGVLAEEVVFNPRSASLFLENEGAGPCRLPKGYLPDPRPAQAKLDFDHSVTVSRYHGSNLGIIVDQSEGIFLRVQAVNPGLIKDWNREHPTLAIREGDLIVEVNGITGNSQLMFTECKRRTLLHMKVKTESVGPTEVYELGQNDAVMLVNRAMHMVLAYDQDTELDETRRPHCDCGPQYLDEFKNCRRCGSGQRGSTPALQSTSHVPQPVRATSAMQSMPPPDAQASGEQVRHYRMPVRTSGQPEAAHPAGDEGGEEVFGKPLVPAGDNDATAPFKEEEGLEADSPALLPDGIMQLAARDMLQQSNLCDDPMLDEERSEDEKVLKAAGIQLCHERETTQMTEPEPAPESRESRADDLQVPHESGAEGKNDAAAKSTAMTSETAAIEKRLLEWMDIDNLGKDQDAQGIIDLRFGSTARPPKEPSSPEHLPEATFHTEEGWEERCGARVNQASCVPCAPSHGAGTSFDIDTTMEGEAHTAQSEVNRTIRRRFLI